MKKKTNLFTSLGLDLNPSNAKMYLAVGLTTNADLFFDFSFPYLCYEIF
jgi:hypothetical protein